jgi:hypothetical protein
LFGLLCFLYGFLPKGGKVMITGKRVEVIRLQYLQGEVRVDGWLTEQEAAALRNKIHPNVGEGPVNRSTISKWRKNGLLTGIHLHNRLWLVKEDEVRDLQKPAEGNPTFRTETPKRKRRRILDR